MGKKTNNSREIVSCTPSINTPLNLSLKSKPSNGKNSTKDEEATFPKPKIQPNIPKKNEYQPVKDFIVLDVNKVEEKVVDSNKRKTTPRPDTLTNLNKDNKNQEDNVAE